MADTTILSDNVDIIEAGGNGGSWSAVSWSAVIAGALTAIAVSFIIIALGSGIGLSLASPFASSPSTSTLTVLGAVWLVMAQAVGFATGGYVAGRMRQDLLPGMNGDTKFRDGANGLVVWAIGVFVTAIVLAGALDKLGNAAGNAAATGAAVAGNQPQPLDYYTDMLLRTDPRGGANGAAAAPTGAATGENGAATPAPTATAGSANSAAGNGNAMRAPVQRILITAMTPNGLSNDDRTYLAQLISARTGLSMDDAQKRVDNVVNQARANMTKAADTARKAAEYLSFWTFMSLLFGAVCATLGGVLGGDLRDEYVLQRAVVTAPR